MSNFESTKEMNDAGYAVRIYSIVSDSMLWLYNGERFKTSFNIPTIMNSKPDLPLARIEDVKAGQIG